MNHSKSFLLLWLLLLLLGSCEVPLHENFVEAEPIPSETPIQIALGAEQSSTGEIILVEGTDINYRIQTPESQFIHACFYVDNYPIYQTDMAQDSFQFYTNNAATHCRLRCEVTSKPLLPGESIEDQLTEGTYAGAKEWSARVVTPQLTFYQNPEETTLENVTIRWTFNLSSYYFKVLQGGEVLVEKTKENSITLPAPVWGTLQYIEIRIVDEYGYEPFPYMMSSYNYSGLGTRLKGGQTYYLYNAYSNTLYASEYSEVTSYTVPTLEKAGECKGEDLLKRSFAASPNSDKIALDYWDCVRIFSGKELRLLAKIDYPESGHLPKQVLLTSKDKLVLYYNESAKIYVYNAESGQLEKTVSIPEFNIPAEHYPLVDRFTISENYLCMPLADPGFYLVPLQDFVPGTAVFYAQNYASYAFLPNRPDELLVVQADKIQTRDCRNGQVLLTVPKEKDHTFCNIDPVTGNYLFRSPTHIVITNREGTEIFRLRSEAAYPYLANNILVCWEGIALNVEPHLKKQ